MVRLALALTLAALTTACGAAPTTVLFAAPSATTTNAMAANKWLGLSALSVKAGGPSDWYTRTKRHLDAKTPQNGRLWVLDDPDGVKVLHNTQEITSATKRAQIADAIDAAAEQAAPDVAREAREFSALIRAELKK